MYWIYYSFALSFHYVLDILLTKMLSDKFDLRKIIINTYLISVLVLIAFFPKDIITRPDTNYIYILLFAINILFGLFVWYNAIINRLNLGKMDGLAIAIYLPMLTLVSAYLFKQEMCIYNFIGIVFIAFGSYLILQ